MKKQYLSRRTFLRLLHVGLHFLGLLHQCANSTLHFVFLVNRTETELWVQSCPLSTLRQTSSAGF